MNLTFTRYDLRFKEIVLNIFFVSYFIYFHRLERIALNYCTDKQKDNSSKKKLHEKRTYDSHTSSSNPIILYIIHTYFDSILKNQNMQEYYNQVFDVNNNKIIKTKKKV